MRIIFSIIFSLTLFIDSAFADSSFSPFPFNANYFISAANSGTGITAKGLIADMDIALGDGLESMLIVLYQVGEVVAIGILCFMGIKVLIASPQQKAQLKASLAPYFIGLLLYMVGVPLAVLIINIFITIL